MKKIMLGTSDAWSMSRSSHRPSEPAYYIEDCRISKASSYRTGYLDWCVDCEACRLESPNNAIFFYVVLYDWTEFLYVICTGKLYLKAYCCKFNFLTFPVGF